MRIDSVAIKAYRSLYDVTVHPKQFTVLVGPNNSGKTNLVEALDFLADAYRHGVEAAVTRKGGFENIAHRRKRRTRRPISFKVNASVGGDELERYQRRYLLHEGRQSFPLFEEEELPAVRLTHAFEISAPSEQRAADFRVATERLDITHYPSKDASPSTATILRADDGLQVDVPQLNTPSERTRRREPTTPFYPLDDEAFHDYVERTLTPTSLLISSLSFNDALRLFTDSVGRGRLYQLSPLECRRPGVYTPSADIDVHGGNLPAVVAFMQRNSPESWAKVLDAMRRIVPALSSITIDYTHDRRLTLEFSEEGFGRAWTSEDVSDGTIQSLALFVAVNDPRSSLALIEEPENSVHPWVIRQFVDTCRDVPYKQTLITTHSPALIGYLKPEEVILAWRRDGRTRISSLTSLDPDIQELWGQGRGSVFDLLDSGMLEVAVPDAYRP